MKLGQLEKYFQTLIPIGQTGDRGLNGLQVGNRNTEVHRVAFAVDACLETFQRAADAGAQLLFVHHGIYWGTVESVTGINYTRMETLMKRGLALYALHLPLDLHPQFGNNAQMAIKLGLDDIEPFGLYHGTPIGCKGKLPSPLTIGEIVRRLFHDDTSLLGTLPFGRERNDSVGIISGGAPYDVDQAIEQHLDLYITGESSHSIYHRCLEAGINVIFAGHYQTETWGVKAVSAQLAQDTGLETLFIDLPTGL